LPFRSTDTRLPYRDVEVHDPASVDLHDDLHDDEEVGDREEGRVLSQEVAGPQLSGVVANEGAPGLVVTGRAREHVPADGAGGMLDAELGGQFLGDLVLSPAGVIAGNAFDEGDVIPGNAGSADLARTRLTTPHGFEALAMPTDDGCGLHDDEGVGAAGPETVKSNPEHAILGTKIQADRTRASGAGSVVLIMGEIVPL